MISNFLRLHWLSVLSATALALILGMISALLGILLGPAIQVLSGGDSLTEQIFFTDLFGPYLGLWIARYTGSESIAAAGFIGVLPWLMAAFATLRFVSASGQWFLWERLGELLSLDLRKNIMSRYTNVRAEAVIHDPTLGQEVASLLTTDIRYVREYLVRFYGGLPREGLQILFLTIFLLLLSPKLFFFFAFGVAPVAIMIASVGRKLRKRARVVMDNYQILSEWVQQRLLGIETIKHYQTENFEIDRMMIFNRGLFRSLMRAETTKAVTGPLIEWVALLSIAGVLYLALCQVMNKEITPAVQLSFLANLALISQAGGKLGKYFNSNREASSALSRIQNGLNRFDSGSIASFADQRRVVHSDTATNLRLRCKNLGYQYPGTKQHALSNFDHEFIGGKLYCISGESGAGKSTLLRLLLGNLQPHTGTIEIIFGSGKGSNALESIGYLPQKHRLMIASLASNITYPNIDVQSSAALDEAILNVGLSSLVESLPEGIETKVGEGFRRFSGGQEQRVGLARLLYQRYPIIIIDEGTSALDPETEKMIFSALKSHAAQGGLVIMVAHREAAMRAADETIILKAKQLGLLS